MEGTRCFLYVPAVCRLSRGGPLTERILTAGLADRPLSANQVARPRVSNDNAFVESLFRILKYRPQWPSSGFDSLDEARRWGDRFVRWYNTEHRHSKLRFMTPEQRHNGEDAILLKPFVRLFASPGNSVYAECNYISL